MEAMKHVDLSRGLEKGWKSTEFFMTVLTFILMTLVQAGVLGTGSQVEGVASLVIEGLASLGYGVQRAGLKRGMNNKLQEVPEETARAVTASQS